MRLQERQFLAVNCKKCTFAQNSPTQKHTEKIKGTTTASPKLTITKTGPNQHHKQNNLPKTSTQKTTKRSNLSNLHRLNRHKSTPPTKNTQTNPRHQDAKHFWQQKNPNTQLQKTTCSN
jgi:hypothetical protein